VQVRLSPAEFSVCSCITDWTINIADVCLPQRFNKQNSLSRYEYIMAAQLVEKVFSLMYFCYIIQLRL